jgi:peptide/nickel transport system substrate-binding protein
MAIIGVLLVMSFILAGCGRTTASSNGGTLTVFPSPYGPFTANFNPLLPTGISRIGTQGLIYETLLFINQMNGGQIMPWLASGYRFNSDATSLTFDLRADVKWSDGQAFTSSDVVFTLDMLKRYPALDTGELWKVITTVSAPDLHTVSVTFNRPSVPILWSLAGQTFIVPEHLWKDVLDPTTEANQHPVGTGPFTLKSFNSQLYVLGKNPNFWQPGKPSIDQIEYPSEDTNAMNPPALPDVDWSGIFSSDVEQTFDNQDPAHNHHWFPPVNVTMLYLNQAKAPFNQVAVRQAISAAIDREAISRQAEIGYEPVASPTGLVLPANRRFLDPAYQDATFGKADALKAMSILSAAGFKQGGDGVLEPFIRNAAIPDPLWSSSPRVSLSVSCWLPKK